MDRYRNAVRDKFDRRASTYIHNYRLPRSISQGAKVQRLKAAKAWAEAWRSSAVLDLGCGPGVGLREFQMSAAGGLLTYIHNYRLPRSISQDAKVQRLKAAKAWSRPTSRDFPWPPRPSISSSHSGFSATSPTRKGSLQKPAESCAPEVT